MITAEKDAVMTGRDEARWARYAAERIGFVCGGDSVFCDIFENGDTLCVFVRKGGTDATGCCYYEFDGLENFLAACRELSQTESAVAAYTDGVSFYLKTRGESEGAGEFYGKLRKGDDAAFLDETVRPIQIGVKELGYLAL